VDEAGTDLAEALLPHPPMPPTSPWPVHLDREQTRVHQLLVANCGNDAGQQYIAAMGVLSLTSLPDRFCMVAHQLREMINHIAKFADPALGEAEDLALAARDPRSALTRETDLWKRAWGVGGDDWAAPVAWTDRVDSQDAQTVLGHIHGILAAVSGRHPDREALRRAARGFDPNPVQAPAATYEEAAEELWRIRGYFIRIAHRHEEADEVTFLATVGRLYVALDVYFPSVTIEQITDLDRAIEETERGG